MEIDVATLAKNLADFLAPFIPFLKETGERVVAGEVIKKFGAGAWGQGKALWTKLQPKVEAKPSLQEAFLDVAQAPADEDAQAALRLQLKKLLTEDTTLAAEVAQFWQESKLASVSIITSGKGNVVQSGKHNVNIGKAHNLAIGDEARVDISSEARRERKSEERPESDK